MTDIDQGLEDKLPCVKMIPAVEKGMYACTCKGQYACKGKECSSGSNIDVPEGTEQHIPGYKEPVEVKQLPRCNKYSKPNGKGGAK